MHVYNIIINTYQSICLLVTRWEIHLEIGFFEENESAALEALFALEVEGV